MDLLLDHMLGKQVQRILKTLKHDVIRAIQVGLENYSNSDLYEEAVKLNRILVTCDSDFEESNIGLLGYPSIIYLIVYPDNSLKYLIPVLLKQFPKIPSNKGKDHLITVFDNDIIPTKFKQ